MRAGVAGVCKYLRHFWNWTQGDGLLLDVFPEHCYLNLPNVVELSLPVLIVLGWHALLVLWVVELACETVGALQREPCKLEPRHVTAAWLSGCVKNVVDMGHCWYWVKRGRLGMLCSRFDWFAGLTRDVIIGERRKFAFRSALWALALWCR